MQSTPSHLKGSRHVNLTRHTRIQAALADAVHAGSAPGNDAANPLLADLVLASNAERDDMTAQYLDGNLFGMEHPGVVWLRQCCNQAIIDYARNLGIEYDLEWSIQAWANVNMKGDYHNLHNHPHLAERHYYIAVPDQTAAEQYRSDLNFAAISFYDPRPQANMNAIQMMVRLTLNTVSCRKLVICFCGRHSCITLFTRTALMPAAVDLV